MSAAPTIVLAAIALGGWCVSVGLAIAGELPLAAGAVLAGLCAYLGWTPLHEAAHGNIARGRPRLAPLETAIGWACGVPLFAPFHSLRRLHLRHHAHTNDPARDPDHWVAASGVVSVALRCLSILPHYYSWFLRTPAAERSPYSRTLGCQLVFAGVFAGAAWAGSLGALLVLWPLTALLAAAALAFFFDWLPHHPHDGRERMRGSRVILAPLLPLITLGHSYHLVHHLWPEIPFHRYGEAFRRERAALESAGARIDRWG